MEIPEQGRKKMGFPWPRLDFDEVGVSGIGRCEVGVIWILIEWSGGDGLFGLGFD